MTHIKNFVKRYELVLFFPLTYVLSWWAVPVMQGALIPHGPALAAVILIALTLGRQGVSEYWHRLNQWRAGWWYVVGPMIIVGYTGIAFAISLMSGATMVETPQWLTMGVFIQLFLLGGLWEEPGWTGYALPKLEARFADQPNGKLTAALTLGIFRALWHLPLFLYGKMYWFDIFMFSFAYQLIIAWLYHRSRESVPCVMLFHFVSNVLGAIMWPVFAGGERYMFYLSFISLAVVFALGLVGFSQFRVRRERVVAV